MTTLAMVFGMVPLAPGMAEGAEQRAPMGQAVIGGIITSSLLTLVVEPVIYTYLATWVRRKWGQPHMDETHAAETQQSAPGGAVAPVLQSKKNDAL
jgi:HAE1 family hydrophobic/amphiphilic exporter-1